METNEDKYSCLGSASWTLENFIFAVDAEKAKGINITASAGNTSCRSFRDLGIEEEDVQEIASWSQRQALHVWMRNLYVSKGGENQFNVNKVRLTESDLDALEKDIKDGSFFVADLIRTESDLKIIQKARDAIKQGKAIFYESWW